MTNEAMLQRIILTHNKLAQIIENGVDLKSGSNVILMADVLTDLRALAQEVQEAVQESAASVEQSETR